MTTLENNTEGTGSMTDDEFFEYASRLQREREESLRNSLPSTDVEWLKIFPEAKPIIPEKIKEWEEVAVSARKYIQNALCTIKGKSEPENQWFWREVLKYTFPPVTTLATARKNIKRLVWLLRSTRHGQESSRRMWMEAVQRARESNLVYVAESYGLKLKHSGKTFNTLCPKHNEHTPSFHIYPPTHFVCYGCGIKGDVISFVRIMDGCSFREAVYKLSN